MTEAPKLEDDDVHTLIGHAVYLRGRGQEDMPRYFFGLAARIARSIGDEALAQRVEEIMVREFAALSASSGGEEGKT